MLRCFFFQLRAAMLFFFWLNSPTTSLAFGQWIVSFFSTQSFGQANRACLKKKHLLSLVTCCHWSQGKKKKQLGNEAKSFFFPRFIPPAEFFLFAWPGPFISSFFSSICFFFAFFCQMSNLCEKKKSNTHSNLESCFRLKKKFPKRNVVNDVIGWFSSFATMCYI